MKTFDIVVKNIKLRVICDENQMPLIFEHFKGFAKICPPVGQPNYTLITSNDPEYKLKVFNTAHDKWFNNASVDYFIDNENKTCTLNNIQGQSISDKNSLLQFSVGNVFNRLLKLEGYIAFHSSCVEKDGKSVAFLGYRNSGKTNCMLNLMNAGYNSVSNDKIAVTIEDGKLVVIGISQDVSIRLSPEFVGQEQNKKYLPIIKEQNISIPAHSQINGQSLHMSPMQLAEINHVKQINTSSLDLIVFPAYQEDSKELITEKVEDENLYQLLSNQLVPLVHETKSFLDEIYYQSPNFVSKEDVLRTMCKLSSYKFIQNEHTYDDFIKKIEDLLDTTPIELS